MSVLLRVRYRCPSDEKNAGPHLFGFERTAVHLGGQRPDGLDDGCDVVLQPLLRCCDDL